MEGYRAWTIYVDPEDGDRAVRQPSPQEAARFRFKAVEVVDAAAYRGAVDALEHIAHHGEDIGDGEPCRRPPQDCAQDALDRLGGR